MTRIRIGAAAGATALLVLTAPLAAAAHVTVNPDQAEPGSYAQLSFSVPNESDEAATTSVRITLPTDTPFSYVALQPVAGWDGVVTTETLPEPVEVNGTVIREAAVAVTWTAQAGNELGPGQFQNFVLSAGPVPDTGSIVLPATQTYTDGEVVEWNQPTPTSGEEPELPAPTLYVNDAPPTGAHGGDHGAGEAGGTDAASASSASATGTLGLVLGAAGLGLGLVALVVAAIALARSRRRAA